MVRKCVATLDHWLDQFVAHLPNGQLCDKLMNETEASESD